MNEMMRITSFSSAAKPGAGHTRAMDRHLRKIATLVLVLAALYIVRAALPPAPTADTSAVMQTATSTIDSANYYKVGHVVDGDTIDIIKDGARVPVRLIGINTPEVAGPYTKLQCYGPEASAEAKRLMTGTSVRVVSDPTQDLHDKYGRLLAYVYLPANSDPNGLLVNEFMVREGFAREYTYKKPYEQQSVFKADEAAARAAQKGLWSACPNS